MLQDLSFEIAPNWEQHLRTLHRAPFFHDRIMATYLYETIPSKPGDEPHTFEVQQSMKDAPLAKHPETGEPVRRVITGGFGFVRKGSDAPAPRTASSGGGCGSGCGCH
jgi:predicted nucleic acid-binding Zn ribbon protein